VDGPGSAGAAGRRRWPRVPCRGGAAGRRHRRRPVARSGDGSASPPECAPPV